MAKACFDYYGIEPEYLAARRTSGEAAGKFAIPSGIAARLLACARLIDSGTAMLSQASSPHAVPFMTIGQFSQAAAHIRELARGTIDGYGYDYDLVGQRFGMAFTSALVWTQHHHR